MARPQIHLHYAASPAQTVERRITHALPASIRQQFTRNVVTHRWMRRAQTVVQQVINVVNPVLSSGVAPSIAQQPPARIRRRLLMRHATPVVPSLQQRHVVSRIDTMDVVRRVPSDHHTRSVTRFTRELVRSFRLTGVQIRRGSRQAVLDEETSAPRLRPYRPAEITWRASLQSASASSPNVAPVREFEASAGQRRPAPVETPRPASDDSVPAPRAPLRIEDFDASLVDRLADNVIHRVERRVRIERERRGM
jgi:hypothetical protein